MALPFGPYQGQDLINYEAGNKFLPREFYSLKTTPSTTLANQIGNTGGITGTQAAGPYMGYPSYEAWLLAQGGGGGGNGGGGRDDIITNPYNPNQNLGPTNITDYESEAYGVGPTWAGSWAKLKDDYSKIPTPTNLLRKGIRRWKEKKEFKAAQEQQASKAAKDAADAAAVGQGTDIGGGWTQTNTGGGGATFTGGDGQTHQGWSNTPAGFAAAAESEGTFAQGGRIGLRPGGIVDAGKQYYGKEDWEIQQINQYGVSYPEFLANQGWPPLKQMDASQIAAAADAWKAWKKSFKDGGIARLL